MFDRLLALIRLLGPVKVLPEKTRIAFQTRMSFAAVRPARDYLAGHLVLARRPDKGPFVKVETLSARNHLGHFRLREPGDLTEELAGLVAEAYEVGRQEHLKRR